MRLRDLTRKARKRLVPQEEDVCRLLFSRRKAQRACRLFLDWLKEHGECTRRELSRFASDLQAGRVAEGFTYRRSSFYRQIRRTLIEAGLIALEPRFEGRVIYKYAPVRQPIPKRLPDGWSFWRLVWILCKRWNDEFEK